MFLSFSFLLWDMRLLIYSDPCCVTVSHRASRRLGQCWWPTPAHTAPESLPMPRGCWLRVPLLPSLFCYRCNWEENFFFVGLENSKAICVLAGSAHSASLTGRHQLFYSVTDLGTWLSVRRCWPTEGRSLKPEFWCHCWYDFRQVTLPSWHCLLLCNVRCGYKCMDTCKVLTSNRLNSFSSQFSSQFIK